MWWKRGEATNSPDPRTAWPEFIDLCRERVVAASAGSGGPTALEEALGHVVAGLCGPFGLTSAMIGAITREAAAELTGGGAIDALLERPGVSEIMVNGLDPVWVEQGGRLHETSVRFADENAVRAFVERMLRGSGRRVDEGSPIVDARLADGSRLNAVLPPVSALPLVTIRRFSEAHFDMAALVKAGMLDRPVAAFLHAAVSGRAGIVISGATGSGKTTLLAALGGLIGRDERVVIAEDVSELQIDHPNVAAMQCRDAGPDGGAAVDMRRLVRNALRMRPDRIIVGEVRGPEAADLAQALNTGHAGSMTSVHANSCADALMRLESLVEQGIPGIDPASARSRLAAGIELGVHCERRLDGTRRITEVAEVTCVDGEWEVVPIFGDDDGDLVPTGVVPQGCLTRMARHGVLFPPRLLRASA